MRNYMYTGTLEYTYARLLVYLPTPPSSLDKTRLIHGRIKRKRRCNGGRGEKEEERELPVRYLKVFQSRIRGRSPANISTVVVLRADW